MVQTGDPEGPSEGFVDPSTGKVRTIPLEIMVDGDSEPIYGATLEVFLQKSFVNFKIFFSFLPKILPIMVNWMLHLKTEVTTVIFYSCMYCIAKL